MRGGLCEFEIPNSGSALSGVSLLRATPSPENVGAPIPVVTEGEGGAIPNAMRK